MVVSLIQPEGTILCDSIHRGSIIIAGMQSTATLNVEIYFFKPKWSTSGGQVLLMKIDLNFESKLGLLATYIIYNTVDASRL